jgi:hypothetical protein
VPGIALSQRPRVLARAFQRFQARFLQIDIDNAGARTGYANAVT